MGPVDPVTKEGLSYHTVCTAFLHHQSISPNVPARVLGAFVEPLLSKEEGSYRVCTSFLQVLPCIKRSRADAQDCERREQQRRKRDIHDAVGLGFSGNCYVADVSMIKR